MAITIDATVGGGTANSYVSLAEATAYFAIRTNAGSFTGLQPDPQSAALLTAALRIDAENYRGTPASSTQAMKWPRSGLFSDGSALSNAVIPRAVKQAQMELALAIANAGTADLLGPTGTENLDRVRAGSVEVQFRNPYRDAAAGGIGRNYDPLTPPPGWDPSQTLPPQVFRLLRNWIVTQMVRRQPGFVKLARG